MERQHKRVNVKKLIVSVLFIAAAVTVASLTIGRDIYSGKAGNGLWSFAIVSLAGYLFFLFIPVEVAFIYYVNAGENILWLNMIAMGTAIFSQSVDYLIGYSLSTHIIDILIGRKRFEKAENRIRHYGNLTIFIFNLFPLSSPVVSLAAGMLKHRIRDTIFFTVSGLLLKYLMLSLVWPLFH